MEEEAGVEGWREGRGTEGGLTAHGVAAVKNHAGE